MLTERFREKTQRGMTLLEVLIAVVIMAIGLLGISGMLMLSSKAHNSSYNKQHANQIVSSIFDRIRSNYQAAINGNYNISNITASGTPGSITTPAVYCDSSVCNAQQLATFDTWYWLSRVVSTLPNGSGSIATASTGTAGNTLVTVTLQWDDSPAQSQMGAIGEAPAANANLVSLTIQSQL
ncbi:type IV pilus modification protein PilV [Legionella spiritensis]|uniref:Type IV fimbrial biogenesis protein PilV n=1 Tax=Legionella spiritensis TaxID=452 RepID=A0A0W0YW98_LEGSP|nr:type IV pilus modification protein PilV [Legionella spiritensis]KTD61122.1 type IV fimbrial biogenesis protein PilV [Legionella spiritensis]SNV45035.1 type IV fimbrial biogenesis protein PilV [Legionella spiritensis]VEG90898.1 type IV fimbrial biogenesis protein PilV [Legionella spiritensis]